MTSASAGRESLSDEGFLAEDRHNPLPHIALSATALKSAYRNTAFLSTHTAAELRNFRTRADRNGNTQGLPDAFSDTAGLREVCYREKGDGSPG